VQYNSEAVKSLASHPGWHSLKMLFDVLRDDLIRQFQEASDVESLFRIQGALQTCTWLRSEFIHRVETPRQSNAASYDNPEEFLKQFRASVTHIGVPQGESK
jgi:hypothetical protein